MERRAFLKLTGLLVLAGVMPANPLAALPAPETLQVFLIDECDWVAGASREAVIAWYTRYTGIPERELEVAEAALAETMFWGEPGDPDIETVTFAEAIRRMRARDVRFPEMVASTEY